MRATDTFYDDLANRLRELRTIAGYKQEEIASLLEVTAPAYRSYEIGNRRPPLDMLVNLADIYKVSIDYILGNSEQTDIYEYIGIVKNGLTGEQIEKIKQYAELVRQNLL